MTSEPLLGASPLDSAIARRDGVAIDRRQYLADVAALCARLPARGAMLNLSSDRYRFYLNNYRADTLSADPVTIYFDDATIGTGPWDVF